MSVPRRIALLGVEIDDLVFEEFAACLSERIRTRIPGYIVTPNTDHVCRCGRDPKFKDAYEGAAYVLVDGVPLMWAARLLGVPLREKLSGSDMLPKLAELAAREGFSVYFLGGMPGTAQKTALRFKERFPALDLAGWDCPEMGFEKKPKLLRATLDKLRAAKPDICFVGLGCPKQEYWMQENLAESGATVMIGIGGAFDFESGRVRRAPRWLQSIGCEWLWRLLHEPRRLWRRYLVEDLIFFRLLWNDWRKYRRAGGGTGPHSQE